MTAAPRHILRRLFGRFLGSSPTGTNSPIPPDLTEPAGDVETVTTRTDSLGRKHPAKRGKDGDAQATTMGAA